MKKELLEYIIRETVKQLLEAGVVDDPTVGAPAPPEATGQGTQGTGDQPAIQPPPNTKFFANIPQKGIWFVDSKNPQRPIQLQFRGSDPRSIESAVYNAASKSGGANIRPSLETLRNVTNALKNPSSVLFLYNGLEDPEDPEGEISVQSAKTHSEALQGASLAQDKSMERGGTAISSDPTDLQGMAKNWQNAQAGGKTLAPDIDEGVKLRNMLTTMIREALKRNSK